MLHIFRKFHQNRNNANGSLMNSKTHPLFEVWLSLNDTLHSSNLLSISANSSISNEINGQHKDKKFPMTFLLYY